MISRKQVAHDLSIAYINNRYGVNVTGGLYVSDGSGSGDVTTEHLPDVCEPAKHKIETGEKNILGFKKKVWIESGYVVDKIFINMICDYKKAYLRFLELLD